MIASVLNIIEIKEYYCDVNNGLLIKLLFKHKFAVIFVEINLYDVVLTTG